MSIKKVTNISFYKENLKNLFILMKSELHQLTHKKICQKIFQNYTRVSIPCNIDFKASKKNPI